MIYKINLFIIFISLFAHQGCDSLSTSTKQNLNVDLNLDKYSYSVGDTLIGEFEVTNNSDEDKTFNFGSACQYGVRIKDSNTIYSELPEDCAAVLTKLHLKSGDSRSFSLHFKLMDQDYQDLEAGQYSVQAFLLIKDSEIAEKTIEIK